MSQSAIITREDALEAGFRCWSPLAQVQVEATSWQLEEWGGKCGVQRQR